MKKFERHGMYDARLYGIWKSIKQRCNNPNAGNYGDYGGRGIKICDEWENSFITFRDWAIANGYSDNLTIDRANNDGNYEPLNCKWATREQQAHNTRIFSTNTSGERGVCWYKPTSKWAAYITAKCKTINLGYYADIADAVAARTAGEIKYWGREQTR